MSWFDPPARRTKLEIAIDYIRKLEAEATSHREEIMHLTSELRSAQRMLERAIDDRRSSWPGESDATRKRVLQQQALRARLGKRDMSPEARLRTLKAAKAAGLKLSDEQRDELWDIELGRD